MQNRFGVKDAAVLVVLLGVVVSLWLAMFQKDRQWVEVQKMSQRLTAIETSLGRMQAGTDGAAVGERLGRIESALAAGVRVAGGGAASGGGTGSGGVAGGVGSRDESWARPGEPVVWGEPWGWVNDPRKQAGFVEGGEFCESMEGQPPKVMPFLSQDVYGRRVTDRVCEPLGDYDPADLSKFRGVLAEAWQLDPAGLWLRVKINPRARFSDGEPVTAEDVRYTYMDFINNPQIDAARVRAITDMISGVTVVSPLVAEFTFKQANYSNRDAAMNQYILPKHFYEKLTPAQINKATGLLMGSGPFKMATMDAENQWTPPADVVLVRNEGYWGTRPALERLRFKVIRDELSRLTAYRNGEADMTTPLAPQFVRATKEPGWEKENQSLNWINMRSGYSFIAWQCGPRNGKLTPFVDRRVRLAMTHALDRERMVREVWEGTGVVASQPANTVSPAADPTIKPWPYDLAEAKRLLAEAGWTDRNGDNVIENERGDAFTFEFTYATGGEVAERIARYVQGQSALVGIRCTLNAVDWSIYADLLQSRNFDAITLSWQANAPESDPSQIYHSKSIKDQGDNFVQWANEDADRLIDAGRREMNDPKRMAIWHELHRLIHREQPYTFVRIQPWLRFVKSGIGNVRTYPKGPEIPEFSRSQAVTAPPG
ncbi:MAG: ABC transporter substrate-binding protein [Phycisphaerales bacterium]